MALLVIVNGSTKFTQSLEVTLAFWKYTSNFKTVNF